LTKPAQFTSIEAVQNDAIKTIPKPKSFKFKEVRVLLKRVNIDSYQNTENKDEPDTEVISDEDLLKRTEESNPGESKDLVTVQTPIDAIRPEISISKGMFMALLEKRQTENDDTSTERAEVGNSVSDVAARSIEETFRIKEAVQVVLKKDPDEVDSSSQLQLGTDSVKEANGIIEPDEQLNSTLKEELEEDSRMSQVIDDVLHDLDDPESSLTKIMDIFETEDLDALAEIEEGTFDSVPTSSAGAADVERTKTPEFEYLGAVDQKEEERKRNGAKTVPSISNGEKKEVQTSSDSQEVYIYSCPFDKCSFSTDFQGIRLGSGAMHVINVHKMEPFMFKMKGLKWKKLSVEEQMENMFANA